LTQTSEKADGYDMMIGQDTALYGVDSDDKSAVTLYIPLQFWFCRNPGLALPLIALQYHEVKFNVTFKSFADCKGNGSTYSGTPSLSNASLYIDYIYLDTDERRQFAQVQHEYLIEQLQFTGAESFSNASVKSKLALNPEQHQPSGTVNMSRIDNATLMLTLDSAMITATTSVKLRLYAVNYNVLRIMAGEHISPYSRQQECIHKRNMLVECF